MRYSTCTFIHQNPAHKNSAKIRTNAPHVLGIECFVHLLRYIYTATITHTCGESAILLKLLKCFLTSKIAKISTENWIKSLIFVKMELVFVLESEISNNWHL